jgi:retinol dehydrogenase 12
MEYDRNPGTALVSGGTDGIGKEIARGLASRGVRLIVVGRDADKGRRAEQELSRTHGNAGVTYFQADLSLVREADRLAAGIRRQWRALNYLVLCAGSIRARQVITDEGVESNFALNYLTRFVLTRSLLPVLHAAGTPERAARILLISGAARHGKIHFDDVNLTRSFSTVRMVLQSCQANDTLTVEWARRYAANERSNVRLNCLKVGVVKTSIRAELPRWMQLLAPLLFDPLLAQAPATVARSAVRLLLSSDFESTSGALFQHIRKFKSVGPDRGAADPRQGLRLWELGERLALGAMQPKASEQ